MKSTISGFLLLQLVLHVNIKEKSKRLTILLEKGVRSTAVDLELFIYYLLTLDFPPPLPP